MMKAENIWCSEWNRNNAKTLSASSDPVDPAGDATVLDTQRLFAPGHDRSRLFRWTVCFIFQLELNLKQKEKEVLYL